MGAVAGSAVWHGMVGSQVQQALTDGIRLPGQAPAPLRMG